MKRVRVLLMFLVNTIFVNAQTSNEWFQQKETQIKYLVEQIGAFEAYGKVINKGYDIAHNGLTNIFNSKDEDFGMHARNFLSLWKVKSGIRNYSKVVFFIRMKEEVENSSKVLKTSATDFLNRGERAYISKVYSNLIDASNALADELDMVIHDDHLQLKDDERIERIDKIYLQMLDRYQFSRYFNNEIKILVINRLKEKAETKKLSQLFGLK